MNNNNKNTGNSNGYGCNQQEGKNNILFALTQDG